MIVATWVRTFVNPKPIPSLLAPDVPHNKIFFVLVVRLVVGDVAAQTRRILYPFPSFPSFVSLPFLPFSLFVAFLLFLVFRFVRWLSLKEYSEQQMKGVT